MDSRGFTTWEFLIVLCIAGVLAAMAVPGFAAARRSAALTASVNQMVGSLHLARSTAIMRATPAVLCLSADGRQCLERPAPSARGWLVFIRNPANEEVLRHIELPPDMAVAASRASLTFWPTSRSGTTGTFVFCHRHVQGDGRAVIVSKTGRPRVAPMPRSECTS